MVAAIAAPPNPYVVALYPPGIKTDPSQWPGVQLSCIASDGGGGDPAVRLKQWVDAFGSNGVFEQMCQDSYAPALQAIAGQITRAIGGAPCLDAKIDPATCTFSDDGFSGNGAVTHTPLPRCAASKQLPCWDVESDPVTCPSGVRVVFDRAPSSQGPETSTATCSP